MPAWYESRFTGLLSLLVHVDVRPHDPTVHIAAGEMPPWHAGEQQPPHRDPHESSERRKKFESMTRQQASCQKGHAR